MIAEIEQSPRAVVGAQLLLAPFPGHGWVQSDDAPMAPPQSFRADLVRFFAWSASPRAGGIARIVEPATSARWVVFAARREGRHRLEDGVDCNVVLLAEEPADPVVMPGPLARWPLSSYRTIICGGFAMVHTG